MPGGDVPQQHAKSAGIPVVGEAGRALMSVLPGSVNDDAEQGGAPAVSIPMPGGASGSGEPTTGGPLATGLAVFANTNKTSTGAGSTSATNSAINAFGGGGAAAAAGGATQDQIGGASGGPASNNAALKLLGGSGGASINPLLAPAGTTTATTGEAGPPHRNANAAGGALAAFSSTPAGATSTAASSSMSASAGEGASAGAAGSKAAALFAAKPKPPPTAAEEAAAAKKIGNVLGGKLKGKSAAWNKARGKLEEKGTLKKRADLTQLVSQMTTQNKIETEEQTLWRQKVVQQLEVEREWRKRRDGVVYPSMIDDIYCHTYFESGIMFCVVLNLIVFSLESDIHNPEDAKEPRYEYVWWWSELFFFLVYLGDLLFRILRCKTYFRRFFFPPHHLWDEAVFNWVDSFCLATQFVELITVSGDTEIGVAVMFKLLRLLRLSRLRKYEEVVVVFRTTQRVLVEIGPDLLIVSMTLLCLSVTLRQYVKYRGETMDNYTDEQNAQYREVLLGITNTWFRSVLVVMRLWLQDNSMPFIDILGNQDWWMSIWFLFGLLIAGVVLMNIVSGRVTKIMFEVVTEERRRRATVGMERFLKNMLVTNGLLWMDSSSITVEPGKENLTPTEQINEFFESMRGTLKTDANDIVTEEDLIQSTKALYDLLLLPISLLRIEYDEKSKKYTPGHTLRTQVLRMPRQAYLNYLGQVEKYMVRKAFIARKSKEMEKAKQRNRFLDLADEEKRHYGEVHREVEGMVSVLAMNDVFQTLFDEGQMESVAVSLLQIQEEVAHTKRLLDAFISHTQKDEHAPMEMAYKAGALHWNNPLEGAPPPTGRIPAAAAS